MTLHFKKWAGTPLKAYFADKQGASIVALDIATVQKFSWSNVSEVPEEGQGNFFAVRRELANEALKALPLNHG